MGRVKKPSFRSLFVAKIFLGIRQALHVSFVPKAWSICLALFVCMVSVAPLWANDSLTPAESPEDGTIQITAIRVDKKNDTIEFDADHPLTAYQDYSSLKLLNPYRLVVDLPNTRLNDKLSRHRHYYEMNHNGVGVLHLEETRGLFFNSVRMTLTAVDYDTLNRLNVSFEKNRGVIALSPSLVETKPKNPLAKPVQKNTKTNNPATKPVSERGKSTLVSKGTESIMDQVPERWAHITNVTYNNQALHIETDKNHPGQLRVKNRLVLTQPNRLVYDFSPAVLSKKSLQSTITVGDDKETRQIRIGQFEHDTVRVVIETNKPHDFALTALNQNFKSGQLSRFTDSNQEQLSSVVTLATLDKINLDMVRNVAKLRITADKPIVHRWRKENNQLIIELLNIAATPGRVAFDKKHFPFIQEMAVYPLTANQPNSQFVVSLNQLPFDIEMEALQLNGDKTLELQLKLPVIGPSKQPVVMAKAKKQFRVVVDAGHGGKDQGASRAGVLEKDLNLSVALKLKKALEARGIKVYMTRWTDKYLQLKQITDITNKIQPDAFVSVHHNASTNPAISGIETYFYTYKSKPFANKVHAQMTSHSERGQRGVRRAKFYVIHHTNVPAILCEIGYVSNTKERNILKTPASQAKTAEAIANGVVQFLNGD